MPPANCPTCGERIQASIGECLFCPPPETTAPAPAPSPTPPPPLVAAPAAPVVPAPTASAPAAAPPASAATAPNVPAAAPDLDRAFGLLLFEAEECLARGNVDKALVHASRAVKERPRDLTARSLFERARRGALRGRRREKLESRLGEARVLYDGGQFEAAEKIVTTALKLVPDHEAALQLFARLKDRRLQAATPEAEAERELDRHARAEARRAADAARAAMKAGWERRAVLIIRRGLRLVPDDADLLSLLAEAEASIERGQAPRGRRRALQEQVRSGLDALAAGSIEESLKTLRAVLREDVDFIPAQEAIQKVRHAWLEKRGTPATAAAAAAMEIERSSAAVTAPRPATAPSRPAVAVPAPVSAPPRPAAPPVHAPATSRPPLKAESPAIPAEILLGRRRRTGTPWGAVLGGAAILAAILAVFVFRGERRSAPRAGTPPATVARAAPTPAGDTAVSPAQEGPLTRAEPGLREAVRSTLTAYARALESADADLLAQARPDLSPGEREELLAPFRGALNVATDLRVLDVIVVEDAAEVPVLRTDVIVGGHAPSGPPVEEILRFRRRDGEWALLR